MKSFEQLAQAAHRAYCKRYGGKELSADGSRVIDMATWDELEPSNREAWVAAVKQVVAEYAAVH
jgi:hypothetical protein